ncbi:MAG TPA: ABC transporter permease, partial [Anaerolineae bacterium]|nr:ABC transporter permease [Anaerolineae bacterium]
MAGYTHSQLSPQVGHRPQAKPQWPALLAPLLIVALWQALVWWKAYPAFFLPSPPLVWQRFLTALADGSLPMHTGITLAEILGGLALGLSVATGLGYLLAKSRAMEQLLLPCLVAS